MADEIVNLSKLHLIPRNLNAFNPDPATDLPEDEHCPICLRRYGLVDHDDREPLCTAVRLHPCGHVFGKHCLKKYLRLNRDYRCVLCRQQITFHETELSKVQKFFQQVSETHMYQFQEQFLFFVMAYATNLKYRALRLKLQRGVKLSTRELCTFTWYHLFETTLLWVIIAFYVFSLFPLVVFTARRLEGIPTGRIFEIESMRYTSPWWPNAYSSWLIVWPFRILALLLALGTILHSATSISIIRREAKRADWIFYKGP